MEVSDTCQTILFQLPNESAVYDFFIEINQFYKPVHAYISIIICIVGAICNFCNIVVLTRKQMRTPVNMILMAMACCDTVVLFSNLVYTTHYTFVAFVNCIPRNWSYGWAMFLISHAHLSLVGHSSSIWLSVMLALIRYITLRRRGKSGGFQVSLKHSYIAIASVLIFVTVMNTPNFLTYQIKAQTLEATCTREMIADPSMYDAPAFIPAISDLALTASCLVFRLAFWISGTVFKLFPCLLLTVLVSLLTRILKEVRENRQRLLYGNRGAYMSAEQSSAWPTPIQMEYTTVCAPTSEANGLLAPNGQPHHDNNGCLLTGTAKTNPYQIIVTAPSSISDSRSDYGDRQSTPSPLPMGEESTPGQSPMPSSRPPETGNSLLTRTFSTKPRRVKTGSGTIAAASRTDRTTRMLLAIVCVFLVTELPQAVFNVLSGLFSEEFRRYIYNSVGDILDLLSLCNACTSFIIYCTMSAQFRNEFRRVFFPTQMKCWLSISNATNQRRCRFCRRFIPRRSVRNMGGDGNKAKKVSRVCKHCAADSANPNCKPNDTSLLKPSAYDSEAKCNGRSVSISSDPVENNLTLTIRDINDVEHGSIVEENGIANGAPKGIILQRPFQAFGAENRILMPDAGSGNTPLLAEDENAVDRSELVTLLPRRVQKQVSLPATQITMISHGDQLQQVQNRNGYCSREQPHFKI